MTSEQIIALATLVSAIGAVVVSLLNARRATAAAAASLVAKNAAEAAKVAATASQAAIIETKDGVYEVGKQIDGRLTELLKLTREAALAEGRLEGRASK